MKDWKTVKLGILLTESKIESENPDTKRRIRVKLNVEGVEQRPDINDKEGATKYYIRRAGQFIYGKQNLHKGAFGIVPNELDGFESSQDIPAFDVDKDCYPEWIFYFFKQGDFYRKLESLAKGIGSKRIQPKQIFELNIYLPPLEEQRRIIESISSFEDSLSEISRLLEKQVLLIGELNKAILREAVQGELTAQWREENQLKETGNDLLERIKLEKQKLIREKKIKKGKPLPTIKKGDLPFKLPDNWAWARYQEINEFGTNVSYGVLIPEDHDPEGIPLIRVGDMEGYENGAMPEKYIRKEIAEKFKRTTLKGGELLIVVVGASIGKVAIAHNNWKGANIARAVSRTVVNKNINPKFLFNVIASPYMQEYFKEGTRSVGQPTLNINVIEKSIIPMPPVEEQEAICNKIEVLAEWRTQLERQSRLCMEKAQLLNTVFLNEILGNPNLDFENKIISQPDTEYSILNLILVNSLSNYKNKKSLVMELDQLLKENGKMSAVNLWKMSKYENNIDAFYAELKIQVEEKKVIKESEEKGFLELIR